MEAPFNQLQLSIDQSLRKGDSKIENGFKLESFQNLIVSINSLISRTGKTSLSAVPLQKDIYNEVSPIIRAIHNPSFAIDSSGRIIVANTALAQLLNTTLQNIEGIQVHQIQDEAISSLSKEVLEQSSQTGAGATTPIHIQGRDLELSLHPVRSGDQIDYYILNLYDPNRDEVPT
jgi:transcriptional regulator of aromatic amino acid metabolism